ncbi:MAG: hypothetical protein IJD21_04975 [Oscillospiraceae bacterium]|nr:hypothetical protein [Oscillospiraceae bacterium]
MSEHFHSNEPNNRKPSGAGKTILGTILTVLVTLFLWTALSAWRPELASYLTHQISSALPGRFELTSAFTQLGEAMQELKDPAKAVGDWCVSVFLPQDLTQSTEEHEK